MRILVSIIALAVALAWPSIGEAQSKKSTARAKATTQQKVQRPAKARRSAGRTPCAGYAWWGCTGWDPDPIIRSTLARDFDDDND